MKYLIIAILLLGNMISYGQEVIVKEVNIERAIEGLNFSDTKFIVYLFIQDSTAVDLDAENSRLISLTDQDGNDLISIHQQAVEDYKSYVAEEEKKGRMIFTSRSEDIFPGDNTRIETGYGIEIPLESWSLPPQGTKEVRVKMEVSYFQKSDNTAKLENIAFHGQDDYTFLGQPIKILGVGSMSDSSGKKIMYSLGMNGVNAVPEDVVITDDQGREVPTIVEFYNGEMSFTVPENLDGQPLNLEISYTERQAKTIKIDQSFGLGL